MPEYLEKPFGTFNDVEVMSMTDEAGAYWFLGSVVADALGVDRSTITHMRKRHADEFAKGREYRRETIGGKRRVIYSEEGFLTCCDLANSELAYRLRKWTRHQFRVIQDGSQVYVRPKADAERDDMSDLPVELQLIRGLLDQVVKDQRQLIAIKRDQTVLEHRQDQTEKDVETAQSSIMALEGAALVQPGEATAVQLAAICKWHSGAGGAHNAAVILAALNAEYDKKGWMVQRVDEGPGGRQVRTYVFTQIGVANFSRDIDGKFHSGQQFRIAPNAHAQRQGRKNTNTVFKR